MANSIITAILGGLIFLVIFCYPILMIQWLWLAIACAAWILCTGGLVYVRMENPEKYQSHFDEATNQTIVTEWIKRDYGSQYAYEGFIFSSMVVAIGLLYVIFLNVPSWTKSRLLQRIACYIILGSIILLNTKLYEFVKIKIPWWNPVFDPYWSF